MREDLLKFIQTLTARDRKTLMGKAGKLFEEGGELMGAILPYENQFATTHKFVDKAAVLEEIADCMLVLTSMLYDEKLNVTFEDLEEVMKDKADYWAELQNRELKLKDKNPYEIHVTVRAEVEKLDLFRGACADLAVKPVFLDLELNDSQVIKDLMTSSVFMGNNGEAIREVERIAVGLREKGFDVVRRKVETVPWHPAAPSNEHANPVMPKDCYFECHFAIRVNDERRAELAALIDRIAPDYGRLHLSKNIFKKSDDGEYILMSTYRRYEGVYEDFKANVDAIKAELIKQFEVDKTIVEFSVYDTKVKHDQKWLEAASAG